MTATAEQGKDNGSKTLWLTVVMVLAAFIVGLFPFVIAQTRYVTKDEVETIRTTQIDVLQRLGIIEAQVAQIEANTLATAEHTAAISLIQQELAVLRAQAGAVPGPANP